MSTRFLIKKKFMKKAALISSILMLFTFSSIFDTPACAQITGKLDFSKDTIPQKEAKAANDSYQNTITGSGQRASKQVMLPVEKLKAIVDACAANNINNITVLFATIRDKDIAHYRKHNPEVTSTNSQIIGRQILIFKIPRRAFASTSGSSQMGNSPLMTSLLLMGLYQINTAAYDLPFAEDNIYLTFGTICPPPAACD